MCLKQQLGISLLEVMVSLVLISIHFIVFTKSIGVFFHHYHLAQQKSVGAVQVFSMLNQIKHNFSTRSELLKTWNQENKELLPNAKGKVFCTQSSCRVDLVWGYLGKRVLSVQLSRSTINRD